MINVLHEEVFLKDPTISITPPSAGGNTDEDNGNEDEAGMSDILGGNQWARAEIVFKMRIG